MADNCILCDEEITKFESVNVSKGLETLRDISLKINDGIAKQLQGKNQVRMHVLCRRKYVKLKNRNPKPSSDDACGSKPLLRNTTSYFDFKSCCLYCGEKIDKELIKRHPKRHPKACQVECISKITSLRDICLRRSDDWGAIVLKRIDSECDLIAAEAQYHKKCDSRFYVLGSSMPGERSENVPGRPVDEEKLISFKKLCSFLEGNDECQYSIGDLMEKLKNFSDENESYSEKHLRELLSAHYGDAILFSSSKKCFGTVVSFRPVASRILTDSWYADRKANDIEEKQRIIDAAIAILQEEIKSQVFDCSVYPTSEEISEGGKNQVGEMLMHLLSSLMKPAKNSPHNNQKVLSIAHSIISSVRPRSFVSAVHLGVGVYLHRHFRSKHLIDLLHALGYSVSYSEVCKYEASLTVEAPTTVNEDGFVQFVFDNADHNTRTVDGHGTFHVMGGVKCVTPCSAVQTPTVIPRPKTKPNAETVGSFGFIPIREYDQPKNSGLKHIEIEDVLGLQLRPNSAIIATAFDWIWMAGSKFAKESYAGWSGFMEIATTSRPYDVSKVIPLPFVNLQPSNPTTIYSCLQFAADECKKRQQKCIVTFDQPLYIKAMDIVAQADETNVLADVIVRLGGFHLLMSYMGAVGKIMSGSGLEDMWEEVFAKNSISHMVNGHAYARALRAHTISQAAIAHLVLDCAQNEDILTNSDIQTLQNVFDSILNFSGSDESSVQEVEKVLEALSILMTSLQERSRTGKLWIQYFKQVSIMRDFVRAERTGDWDLHLYSVQRMLVHLHAAGHMHYAKAAHIYLQSMANLKNNLPGHEFERYVTQGYFTVRRSDKFWSGIWTDLTIEQVLMRSMKVSGGLTQSRNRSSSVLANWICTMPGSLQVIEAVEDFAKVKSISSDQHVSMSRSWQNRDNRDLKKFVAWMTQHSPFNKTEELVSLSTGIVADERVNCDSAEHLGTCALQGMVGKKLIHVSLKRKTQAFTMAAMGNTMTINKNPIVVNPNTLFQRITCVVRSDDDLAEYLKYELSPYPQSLFDSVGLRLGTKSKIIQVIDKMCKLTDELPKKPKFILDGGDLLHRVHWPRPATYADVCHAYLDYITRNYGRNVTVVFDGYEQSTKDAAHYRRTAGKSVAKVHVAPENVVTVASERFLSNVDNKKNFLKLLSSELKTAMFTVLQASHDADLLVVETAKTEAETNPSVVVVGTDSDLLVLIASVTKPECPVYLLIPGSSTTGKKIYCSRDLQVGLGRMHKHLLFIHAFMGCDTTSAFYGKGPISGFNKLQSSPKQQDVVEVFNNPNATQGCIAEAGEVFMVHLYGGRPSDGLDRTRFKKFVQTVGKKPLSCEMNLASLPPTSAAARQHSWRVYHQIQAWRGTQLPPKDWGWKVDQGIHIPVMSTLPPAPSKLLNLICCGCKSDCLRNCECKKSGLPCTSMCSECAGESCMNRITPDSEDEDDPVMPSV